MKKDTSWEKVKSWYTDAVGKEGHYYHRNIILPKLLPLLELTPKTHLLDLACGQGILARHIPEEIPYTGVDLSASLIKEAMKLDRNKKHSYIKADVTKPLPFKPHTFTHAVMILALQNVEHPEKVFQEVAPLLKPKGTFTFVLNHPCFRIPRQSSWGEDEAKKLQYRRIDHYQSPLKIPIQAHPSQGSKSGKTWSFHHPLSDYFQWMREAGFAVLALEEWCSDKKSAGKKAKMENRSRKEIPLFLTIKALKVT